MFSYFLLLLLFLLIIGESKISISGIFYKGTNPIHATPLQLPNHFPKPNLLGLRSSTVEEACEERHSTPTVVESTHHLPFCLLRFLSFFFLPFDFSVFILEIAMQLHHFPFSFTQTLPTTPETYCVA